MMNILFSFSWLSSYVIFAQRNCRDLFQVIVLEKSIGYTINNFKLKIEPSSKKMSVENLSRLGTTSKLF